VVVFPAKGEPVAEHDSENVTLNTIHDDLKGGFTDLKTELRGGLADLKATLIAGFRSLPTRETSEEMVRLLREGNRLQEERFAQLDARMREQHLEVQQSLRALTEAVRGIADGIQALMEGQRALLEGQRALIEGQRTLHDDIHRLIARLDALIKGRGDGAPSA